MCEKLKALSIYPKYQYHWQPNSRRDGTDATMLFNWYSVLRFESLTFSHPNMSYHCAQMNQSLSHLIIKPFSRRNLARPCGQLQSSVELNKGGDFGIEASFLSIHSHLTNFFSSEKLLPDLPDLSTHLLVTSVLSEHSTNDSTSGLEVCGLGCAYLFAAIKV